MLFSDANRVIFSKNPLRSVICQFRFPPILTIDVETPAKFQEIVRLDFPEYEEVNESEKLALPERIASIVPKELVESLPIRSSRRHQFMDSDRNWVISLTKDFVALESKQYIRWEDFRTYMQMTLTSLVDVYGPAYFVRTGLRYKNIIDRKDLGLQSTAWHELIASFVLGPLADEQTMANVEENHGTFSVSLNDDGDYVRVQFGLGKDAGDEEQTEKYLLDFDFYSDTEKPPEVQSAIRKLDEYNALNRRLFHGCISNKLHTAMGPEPA